MALATALAMRHLDTDTYYWHPGDPPYQTRRLPTERAARLIRDLQDAPRAVVSGSVLNWGVEVEDGFDLIVFLYVPPEVRVARLREREMRLFGRINPDFLAWAAQYDSGPPEGRSLQRHQAWLKQRRCPVRWIDGDVPLDEALISVRTWSQSQGVSVKRDIDSNPDVR